MKGNRLQVIGYSFLLFVLLSTVRCTLYPTFAAESSPSADIKAKLEELKTAIASKAAKLKQEVDRKLKNKAYVGIVKSKSDTSLTLATNSGPKIVTINQDTLFENKQKLSSKDSKLKSSQKTKQVTLEDYVAALGDIDETGLLTARKIILLPSPSDQHKTYLWGQIVSISDDLITLKNSVTKNIAATLTTDSSVKPNDFVLLTGFSNKNSIFDTKFIYVIQDKTLNSKQITPKSSAIQNATSASQKANPSAIPRTASPSAKPTAKPVSR